MREAASRKEENKQQGGEQTTTAEREREREREREERKGGTGCLSRLDSRCAFFALVLVALYRYAINRHKIAAANLQTIEYTEL